MAKLEKGDIWWIKYLKDNPLKILGALGTFSGGILFLMYYLYIGYLPHLENIGNLTYLLFVMSIMGVVLSLILLSMFITPALFYRKFFHSKTKEHIDKKEFAISLFIMPLILLVVLICSICPLNITKDTANTIAWCISLCIIFIYFYGLHSTRCIEKRKKCKYIESMILLSLIGYIPLLLYIIIILSGQTSISTSWGAIATLVLFSFIVIGINIYIAFEYTPMILKTVSIVSVFLLLIFYTGIYAIVPSAIMHKFHLGDFFAKSMHVSQKGCKIFSEQNISNFKIDKNDGSCKSTSDICVLSNIGTNTLLKLDDNGTIEILSKDITGVVIDRSDNRRCVVYKPNGKVK